MRRVGEFMGIDANDGNERERRRRAFRSRQPVRVPCRDFRRSGPPRSGARVSFNAMLKKSGFRNFALSTGADPDEKLHAWTRAGRVDSDEWNYAVARSATRALGVVVKGRRTSLLRDWPGLLAMWLSIGVAMGAGFGGFGWFAFKRIARQVSFLASLEWAQGWLFAKAMRREELVACLPARHASHAPAQPAIQ
ncbi:sensor c-di-GMP phosphodiesterase-like protein [Paraburkholderia sp. WSM4175]